MAEELHKTTVMVARKRLDSLESPALRAIATIAECGTVSKAAKRLQLTQPALSYQIKKLEAEAGTALFWRTRRGMVPTAAGERLIQAARAVRSTVARAGEELRLLRSGAEGRLRISTESSTAYHWLAGTLSAFRPRYPRVQVEVAVARRPLEALQGGRIDILLTTEPHSEAELTATPLFDDELLAIMPADHPLAKRAHLKATDFAEQSVLVWDGKRSELLSLLLRPAGVRPRYLAEVPVTEVLVEMVRSGLGISVVASWAVLPELDAGELVGVRLTKAGMHCRWFGVWRNRPATPRYVADFLSVLTEATGGEAGAAKSGVPLQPVPEVPRAVAASQLPRI